MRLDRVAEDALYNMHRRMRIISKLMDISLIQTVKLALPMIFFFLSFPFHRFIYARFSDLLPLFCHIYNKYQRAFDIQK